MQYFRQIAGAVDVMPLLNAVTVRADLWDAETARTTHPGSAHSEVSDILLRFNDLSVSRDVGVVADQHESINHPAMFQLPQVRPVVFDLMRRVEGERLGRLIITRLRPGRIIAPHVDGGEHAAYYDRYLVTLWNQPGSVFKAGDEEVFMKAGDVWWFDNGVEHSVVNHSADDRITLIVDIRTFR
jgi:hypothetical protein